MEACASDPRLSHPDKDPIPNAARIRAVGGLLARGIRHIPWMLQASAYGGLSVRTVVAGRWF